MVLVGEATEGKGSGQERDGMEERGRAMVEEALVRTLDCLEAILTDRKYVFHLHFKDNYFISVDYLYAVY